MAVRRGWQDCSIGEIKGLRKRYDDERYLKGKWEIAA